MERSRDSIAKGAAVATYRLIRELRRRHVFRVALAYAAVGWILIEVGSTIIPALHLPDSLTSAIVVLVLLGFPVALVLAWAFEMTPEGVRRTEPEHSPDARPVEQHRHVGRKLDFVIIAVLAVAVAVLGWRQFAPPRHPAADSTVAVQAAKPMAASESEASGIPRKSIAVLPFENLSRDPDNEYFVAGMQDLILTRLAGIGDLKVISRTSTEQYASHPDNLKQIARQLGVAHIVEGSVQKVGNDVLISVQLVDTGTDHHLWAESYQRTLDNIFGVEGEVADKIAKQLQATLTATEASAVAQVPTTNPRAYDEYLRGLNFNNLATKGDWAGNLPQAIAAFKRAVAEDSDFALAWAELSIARAVARFWGVDQSEANLAASEAEAKRALALAPLLPEAHIAMGHVQRFVHHDFVAARKEFQQAVELRPNDARAIVNLAITDWNLGNLDAAIKGSRHAIALDPQNRYAYYVLGMALAYAGDFDGARQAQQRVLVIDPQNVQAYLELSNLELRNGDLEAATRVLDQMAPGTPVNVGLAATRITLLMLQRRFDDARAMAEQYAGTFTTGPASINMAFARANVEWHAGKTRKARDLYRAMVGRWNRAGTDFAPHDRLNLSLAYARLGDEKAAMQALAMSTADKRWSQNNDISFYLWYLAKVQMALDKQSAAIDSLRKLLGPRTHDGSPVPYWVPSMLRLHPEWDPIRDDPRFQALLEQYADAEQVMATSTHE